MAPTEISVTESSVVLNLLRRVRSKKKTVNGKDYHYRAKALLQSTEMKLLLDLQKLGKKLAKRDGENVGKEIYDEGKTKSGGNDDILSLNSFFEKLYNS